MTNAENRRERRQFSAVMIAALAVVVLPSVVVLFLIGTWVWLSRQVIFLVLAGALVYTGADWARWGLSLWFGFVGISLLVAGFVAEVLSPGSSFGNVAPLVALGVLYLVFATVFARSYGIDGWLESRRQRALESSKRGP